MKKTVIAIASAASLLVGMAAFAKEKGEKGEKGEDGMGKMDKDNDKDDAGKSDDAAKGAPMTAPAPPAELAPLAATFKGTWKCTGNMMGGTAKSTWKFAPALDKHWISVTLNSPKTKTTPAFVGNAVAGYDPVNKKYVFVGFDNMGGWVHLTGDAAGADGTWTFTGDMGMPGGPSGPSATTATFTFAKGEGGKGIHATGQANGQPLFDDTCK